MGTPIHISREGGDLRKRQNGKGGKPWAGNPGPSRAQARDTGHERSAHMSEQEQAEVTFVPDDEIRAITTAIVAEDAELLERLARDDGLTRPSDTPALSRRGSA